MNEAVKWVVLHLHNYNSWRFRYGYPCHKVQKVVKTIESLIEAKPDLLENIKKYMMRTDEQPEWMRSIKFIRKTDFHVEFKIDIIDLGSVDVDIVPAMDVISQHDDMNSLYDEMMSKDNPDIRDHYSACLCEKQIKLIGVKPAKVKDLIRLLKYWYKSNNLDLKSYFCEVIGLHVHQKYLNNVNNFKMKKGFVKALELLADFKNLTIIPDGFSQWFKYDDLSIIYVVDLVNPFSNTVPRNAQRKIEDTANKTIHQIAQFASKTHDNVVKVCPESAKYGYLQNECVDLTEYENNGFSFCKSLISLVIIFLIALFALYWANCDVGYI
ncbi:2'-5'-oligoadenylate synthase 2 isoform X2 [Patella vulgata]|uniref:2'-5'-oligoadenylate synthase 2 isoform X2 n=1 Tax=Patella vulgata TaxID=6465 RepID=UPI0024A7F5AB|nr:2'-5'-oligoadenylate synthase 2 isoform X2 [Patella vulgata]